MRGQFGDDDDEPTVSWDGDDLVNDEGVTLYMVRQVTLEV